MGGVADADVDAGLGRAVESPLLQPHRQPGATTRRVDDEIGGYLLTGVQPHPGHPPARRVEVRFGHPGLHDVDVRNGR